MGAALPALYPITDARQDLPLSEQVRRFGEAGFPLVQFRGKPLDVQAQWAELRTALEVAREAGGWPLICVNDRADLAVLAARECLTPWGLHLGQQDLPPSEARRLPGLEGLHLGTSTHHPGEWLSPDPACDHAGVGPVRATGTKADHEAPIGFPGLAAGCGALRRAGVAPVAIGGLGPADFQACFQAGAESVALVSALQQGRPEDLGWQAQVARWQARPPRSGGLVLVGTSGAGKSTLGALLAARLGCPFQDLDHSIEAREGRSIARIFEGDGEARFRALERELLPGLLGGPAVVALGGGAWEQAEVRRIVAASGFRPLWLAESPQRAWARVSGDPGRPLALSREVFFARCRARMAAWSACEAVIGFGRPPERLAEALVPGGATDAGRSPVKSGHS